MGRLQQLTEQNDWGATEGRPQDRASGGKEGIESIADPDAQGCGLKVWMGGSASTEKTPHCVGCWCREMPMGQPGRSSI